MENRFTAKDFFLFLSLGAVLVLLVLMMFQYNHMDDRFASLKSEVEEYRTDIDHLGRTLRSINQRAIEYAVSVGAGEDTVAAGDIFDREHAPAFRYLLEAHDRPDFATGDTLRLSFTSRVEKVSPFTSVTANASEVQRWVQEPLAIRDPRTLEWTGLIAQDWNDDPIMEPLIDEETGEQKIDEETGEPRYSYTYEFQLRRDVHFSDGEPLTAHDVKFTYNFVMDDRIAADRSRASYRRIDHVEVLDSHTIRFRYDRPYFRAFENIAGMLVLPEHYYGQFLESREKAEEYNDSTGHLVGTGPYVLDGQADWNPGRAIILNRNRRYWGVAPGPDRIEYEVFNEDTTRRTAFENGELDLYGAQPIELERLKERYGDTKQFFRYLPPTAGYSYIGWKQYEYRNGRPHEPTVFADKRVRQAMTYLIDRERIRRRVYRGMAIVADGPFHPALAQHNPEISPREHDLEKATELLLEAGCSYEGRRLFTPDGERFRFALTIPAGSETWGAIGNELQQSFNEVGISMEIESLHFDVLVERLESRDFDAITLGWTSGFEIDILQMFHSTRVFSEDAEGEEKGENFVAYRSEELDELIDRARRTMDEDERMKIWHEAHRVLYEDQPYTFLFRRESLLFVDERIENVEIMTDPETGESLERLNLGSAGTPLEWYVPRDRQRYGN